MDLAAFWVCQPSQDLAETNWDFFAVDVVVDANIAHISYLNDGLFRHSNLEVKIKWMESALCRWRMGKLKVRFSTQICWIEK